MEIKRSGLRGKGLSAAYVGLGQMPTELPRLRFVKEIGENRPFPVQTGGQRLRRWVSLLGILAYEARRAAWTQFCEQLPSY